MRLMAAGKEEVAAMADSKSRAKSRGRGSRSDREKWREMEEGDTGEVEEEGPPSWQPSVEEGEVVTEVGATGW